MTIERVGACGASRYGNDTPCSSKSETSGIARREVGSLRDIPGELLAGASTSNLIYALQVFSRKAQMDAGESAILNKKQQIDTARQQVAEAVERAQREAEESAGWNKWTGMLTSVAKIAAVTAAAASIVASGGLAAPAVIGLAGTLMSVFAKPIANVVGGGEKTENALRYGGAGVSLVAGGWGFFAGAGGASNAASTTATVARGVTKGAMLAGGSATVASGGTIYQSGKHAALETHARADEAGAQAQQKQMLRQLDGLIETLKEIDKSFTKAKTSIVKAMESEAAANLTLTLGGVKA